MIPSFPPYLTIDTHNYCNASCGFCPYSTIKKTDEQGFMDRDLFIRLADECACHRSQVAEVRFGNIAESLMGGDRAWWYVEEWAKRRLYLLFASNMTYMGAAEQERLEVIGWIGKIIAHIEDGMGIDKERSMANFELALKRWGPERVRLVQPQTTGLRRWARDPEIVKHTAVKCAADRPNTTMIIGWDGMVTLCCVDTKREVVVGNLNINTIAEVWHGQEFNSARKLLAAGHQDLCNHCDWGES